MIQAVATAEQFVDRLVGAPRSAAAGAPAAAGQAAGPQAVWKEGPTAVGQAVGLQAVEKEGQAAVGPDVVPPDVW